jgi:gamma-glutamyltranspeptidase / glutathione hydrolase
LDHHPSAQLHAAADPLSPTGWDADSIRRALLPGELAPDIRAATGDGDRGIVVGSTGAFATLAGQHALMAGGSAVDAALATAFAQIGLCLGAWVSYAGLFSLVHYSAATGEVDTLSAGFGTCVAETDPANIPSPPTPSGRTALVPGFVAGAYAAHQRFGWLPWKALWSPALHLAERGVPINAAMERIFDARADTLGRTPEGRSAFAAEGRFPRGGELFRQPALAATLQALAEQGPDWMYRGPWAQHFVDLVRRDGGRIQVCDLADYRPRWGEPLNTEFAGQQVLTLPTPDTGGLALLIALALIEAAELGDPARDPDALYWLIQIIETSAAQAGQTKVSALDPGRIAALWQEMLHARAAATLHSADPADHSDFVLTADADGNMAAVCHSINTAILGHHRHCGRRHPNPGSGLISTTTPTPAWPGPPAQICATSRKPWGTQRRLSPRTSTAISTPTNSTRLLSTSTGSTRPTSQTRRTDRNRTHQNVHRVLSSCLCR